MREFHFRLQSILDVRRYKEDQRRMELGVIASRCARLQRDIDARQEERQTVLTVLEPGLRTDDVAYRIAQAAYALRLDREVQALYEDLRNAETERLEAVERYRIARRDADVLERLRDRRAATFRKEQKRDEQKRMDDIAMSRRKHHGSSI